MAIINSVALGKSRGKIGNIVTATLKGQVIAKERNYSPANPKTELQVNSRGKMSNAVLAWQFLALFFSMAMALRKSTESTYNAFVRYAKNFFPAAIAASRPQAAYLLAGVELFSGNWIVATLNAIAPGEGYVLLNTGGLPFNALSRARVIEFDQVSGTNFISDVAITEAYWNAGQVPYASDSVDATTVYAFVYTSDGSKISSFASAEY